MFQNWHLWLHGELTLKWVLSLINHSQKSKTLMMNVYEYMDVKPGEYAKDIVLAMSLLVLVLTHVLATLS